jgi:pSer/pThr/pTyr-binding forkhead associated (FHA) protein
MAYIQVYFNNVLQSQVELRPDPANPVSLGRDPESDIFLDNAGVSALHAVIWKDGEDYVIEDTESRNGVVINGERFQRKVLAVGDEIQVLKYTLKFAETATDIYLPPVSRASSGPDLRKATVEVDLSAVNGAARPQSRESIAELHEWLGASRKHVYRLDRPRIRIGKSRACEVKTGGWFGPAVSATVLRQPNGYVVRPERGASVQLNGTKIAKPEKLQQGDCLFVRGCELRFNERAGP